MAEIIDGEAVAAEIRADVRRSVETLREEGVVPGFATVLMSDDPASETYVSMKQRDCEEVGIEAIDVEIDPTAPETDLHDAIDELNDDPAVHGILVQLPLPDHVSEQPVLERIDPEKDVDGFHPENVGRLVTGTPRFLPCTPHGVLRLLDAADVETEGADVTIVGRSNIVGKPLANLLIQKGPLGNATVTVCHSRTENLAEKVRRAEIVVAACGVPELIDGSMLAEGATVIDVGVNRVERDGDSILVGDVAFDDARDVAGAITPVPGGVGPMTRAMLLYNTVTAASERSGVDVELP